MESANAMKWDTMGLNIRSYLAAMAVLVLAAPLHADMVLVENAKPACVIYVAADASEQAKEASIELQAVIRRMSGAEIPITSDLAQWPGRGILIGHSEQARKVEPDIPSGFGRAFGDEGFVIRCDGKVLLLAGNETPPYQGTWFAVYEFLERLGCRWFFPGGFGEVIPRNSTIVFPEAEVWMKPDFRVRDIWYSGNMPTSEEQKREFVIWKRRNKLTSRGYDGVRPAMFMPPNTTEANCLQFPEDGSASKLIVNRGSRGNYQKTHPEYYALRSDESRNWQMPCWTNPGAADAAIDEISLYFTQYPDARSFAFAPGDSNAMCHCPDCTKAAHGGFGGEGRGNVSDAYYGFVDRVATGVKKRFPHRWIGTLAYHDRFRPPQGLSEKWSNVYLVMAAISNCSLHGYDKTGCYISEQTRSMAEQWSGQATALLYYNYDPFNWTRMQHPAWNSRRIARDLLWLRNHHGWGFTVESILDYTSLGINHYLRGKLAWDVDRDVGALMQDFCQRFFGPASGPMLSYYRLVEGHLDDSMHHPESGMSDLDLRMALWNEQVLSKAERYLSKAGKSASEHPYGMRVAAFRLGFENLKATRASHEAASRADFAEAAQQADRITQIAKELNLPMFLLDNGSGWLGANNLKKFYSALAERTSADGSGILSVFPMMADFRTDSVPHGLIFEWYRPDLETGKEWKAIRLDQGWDLQGVTRQEQTPYDFGSPWTAWYRVRLDIPEDVSEGKVHLLFPAVKATGVWVWINGKFAGHTTAADRFDMEISGRLTKGRHLVALRVTGSGDRSSPYSGPGGIALRPIIYRAGR